MTGSPKGGGGSPTSTRQERLISPFPQQGEIVCPDCDHIIAHSAHVLHEVIQVENLPNEGERQALICQSCKRQYPIVAISPNGVSARSRLQRLRQIGKGTSTEARALEQRVKRETTRLASIQTDEARQ